MSLASISPTLGDTRRRGRTNVALNPKERLRHIQCAALLLGGQFPGKRIAALFGVSRSTVYRWRDRALDYSDPEAEGLRRMLRDN